jgi:aminopeptidase N
VYTLAIPDYTGLIYGGYTPPAIVAQVAGYNATGMWMSGGLAYTTKFAPDYGRQTLPCIDNPAFKTTFDIQLSHPPDYTAVASSRMMRSSPEVGVNGHKMVRIVGQTAFHQLRVVLQTLSLKFGLFALSWQMTTFERTPLLPVYALGVNLVPNGFGVEQSSTSIGSYPVRVYYNSRIIKREFASKAAAYTARVLDQLTQIFNGVRMPFTKMDIIIVDKMKAGGMENWAATTVKAADMLNQIEPISMHTVAHEMAHMWLGNAMTISNWRQMCLEVGNHLHQSTSFYRKPSPTTTRVV